MARRGIRDQHLIIAKDGDCYGQLQSQGGRNYGASGKRDGGVHQISERGGCAGGPPAFQQSLADRSGKTGPPCGIHGGERIPTQMNATHNGHLFPIFLRVSRRRLSAALTSAVALFVTLLFAGCGGHKQAQVQVPPPPSIAQSGTQASSIPAGAEPGAAEPGDGEEQQAIRIPLDAKPIFVETGLASWYGPPYHNRRGSNGEVYNMHAMTAAHRTLPLGSVVRVTNIKTANSAIVRITDRGPFVEGR